MNDTKIIYLPWRERWGFREWRNMVKGSTTGEQLVLWMRANWTRSYFTDPRTCPDCHGARYLRSPDGRGAIERCPTCFTPTCGG